MDIRNRLLDGNKRFLSEISANQGKKELLEKLKKGQNPFAIIVTCSDSRVIPELIFDASLGDLFVIRSAGNVINEGEKASLEYGIRHLGIKYVLVLGHTHCGAIHASIEKEEGRYLNCVIDKIKANAKGERDEKIASINNAKEEANKIKEMFGTDIMVQYGIYDIETANVEIF